MPAKSKKQQRLFGAVLHCKDNPDECSSPYIEKIAKGISREKARHFAQGPIMKETSFKLFSSWMENKENEKCQCKCDSCKSGNCKDCKCKNCKCKNCNC